ncbi:MAG: hypothetical protein GC199_03940 [Alphaproteobacteria bacterium]|nr:hypothetical protein [Alphaproteobacteria bacterium]
MSESDCAPVWVLSEGKAGMENQVVGLAEAVGLPFETKRARLARPWRWMAPYTLFNPLRLLEKGATPLTPPWPRLLIACGRQSVPLSIAIRRASAGRTFTVQCQDPRISPRWFDLVVPPEHDRVSGGNVMPIIGSPNRVTPERLAEAKTRWAPLFGENPCPRIAVLIGGRSKAHDLPPTIAHELAERLAARARGGASLMVTISRRTPPESAAILTDILKRAGAYVWNNLGPNPYFGMLAWADAIVVTSDSVNMATEAGATGRPVHVFPLPGGAPKFDRFHDSLAERGVTRPFNGHLESWRYLPLNETARVASRIRAELGLDQAAPKSDVGRLAAS